MSKLLMAIVGTTVVILAIVGYLYVDDSSPNQTENRLDEDMTSWLWEEQSNEGGMVTVAVRPQDLSVDADVWSFEVSLSTHSVDLGEKLQEVSVLMDDQGNIYPPLVWEGDPPGGHHRSGVLSFDPIVPRPETVTLKIKNIGNIPVRDFIWPTS